MNGRLRQLTLTQPADRPMTRFTRVAGTAALCALGTLGVLVGCTEKAPPAAPPTTKPAANTTEAGEGTSETKGESTSQAPSQATSQAPSQSTSERMDEATTAAAGTLAPFQFIPSSNGLPESGQWKCHPIFADFNEDGHMDMAAIPRLGRGVRAWTGDSEGNWTESSSGLELDHRSCGGGVDFADVNNDGHLDICVGDHCQGVYVFLGDGAGSWTQVVGQLYPEDVAPDGRKELYRGTEDIATGDIDSDGDVDIIVGASDKGGLTVWLNDGTGLQWERSPSNGGLPGDQWTPRVVLIDMNDDGHLDLVATRFDGPRVWVGDGEGFFIEKSSGLPQPKIHGIYIGLVVTDVNLDGRRDLVVANWVDGPEVYFQEANMMWRKTAVAVFDEMYGGAQGVAAGDIDQDGHIDIVCTGRITQDGGYIRGVFALRGNGDETWTWVQDSGLPSTGLGGMTGVALADFTNDGILDVVACSGLTVESVPNAATKPAYAAHLLAWVTSLEGNSKESRAVQAGESMELSATPTTDQDDRHLSAVGSTTSDRRDP